MCILIPLLIFLSPVCGYLPRITIYKEMKTWKEAQAFCRKNHTDLVTIRNAEENRNFSGKGWIGLYRIPWTRIWLWSRGPELAMYTNWDTGEPQQYKHFAYKDNDKWKAHDYSDTHPFVCYDDHDHHYDHGDDDDDDDDNHYLILVKENKTWEEALEHCRSLDGVNTEHPLSSYWNYSYDLASLITPIDHMYARERAQEATTDEVWTGLYNLAGQWLWVSGKKMKYENIPSCPTNGSCGVLEKNGTASFSTRNCQLRRNFFCKKRH